MRAQSPLQIMELRIRPLPASCEPYMSPVFRQQSQYLMKLKGTVLSHHTAEIKTKRIYCVNSSDNALYIYSTLKVN